MGCVGTNVMPRSATEPPLYVDRVDTNHTASGVLPGNTGAGDLIGFFFQINDNPMGAEAVGVVVNSMVSNPTPTCSGLPGLFT